MTRLIRQIICVTVSLVLGTWMLTANAQRAFQGRYEIEVTWGSSSSRIVSAYQVMAGDMIEIPIGTDILSISVSPLTADNYDLRVAVAPKRAATALRPVAARPQSGRFGEPIDLRDTDGDVSLPADTTISVRKLSE